MADNLSIDSNQQLYYSIRLNNSENTLHAWMRHIVNYLTTNNELLRNELQEPHGSQSAVCDGSCDCQSNLWVHEVSYEEHYRKLLMSRVNAGDTNHVNSVDQESLRREASLVMETVDHNRPEEPVANIEENVPMDVENSSDEMSHNSDWGFLMYDSDAESDDSSDPTYEVAESDLIKLNVDYTSDSDQSDQLSDTYEILSGSLKLDDGYSSDSSDRTLKYRRVSRNLSSNTSSTVSGSSVFEYYYCSSDDDSEYVRSESEWDLSSN